MGELERAALEGRVHHPAPEADPAAAALGGALAATAYRGMDHVSRLIAANTKLTELHGPRDLAKRDIRCKTCRTSRGKPAPWPCVTLVEMSLALGSEAIKEINIEETRDIGRVINGTPPHTDVGRKLLGEM